jgi:putative N6-adenine-specific DNA methylase
MAVTSAPAYDAFAIAAPGLAPLVEGELRALGAPPRDVSAAGVEFQATPETLYTANLWLRTASRVVVRIGQFRVVTFAELQRLARKLPWDRFLAAAEPVEVRATCHKSKLYHSDAVAQRILGAIGRPEGPGTLVVVRVDHDICTVSVDSSGELLHRRGYRLATAKAPLRETLAAAMLMGSGWDGRAPLVDPLCGAGTIAIEGALLARRQPPGLHRAFGFMGWPEFDPDAWERVLSRIEVTPGSIVPILASDRDAGATAATIANAERAGVAGDIEVRTCALSAIEPPPGPGWLVTNPPYGERVGEPAAIRDLYARLGQVARAKCPAWTVALLVSNVRMARETRLPLAERLRTTNGGIPIALVVGRVH